MDYQKMSFEGCHENFVNFILFDDPVKQYERIFTVKPGDIVVDIGASVGPFIFSILDKKPSRIYAIEPDSQYYKALMTNCQGMVDIVPIAISDKPSILLPWANTDRIFSNCLKFKDFISKYKIEKIDFLKTDCEGGEYEIFSEENLDWLLKNLKYCVGEWHLETLENKNNFRRFRDSILSHFKRVEVFSIDGVDIKWDLNNDHFIEYYINVTIHIEI